MGQRKTARSRLAKRLAHEPVTPARKIAIRTSLSRRAPKAGPSVSSSPGTDHPPQDFAPSNLTFREVVRKDWAAINRLLMEAFGRANEGDLVERLRASRDIAGEFVADYAGRSIAYVAFSNLNASVGGKAIRTAGLAPVAVAGGFERLGVATRLTVFGLENMRGLGHCAVFVLGEPSFYQRFGFSSKLAARFTSAWSGPHYMAMEFEPGALRGEGGVTDWPEAFAIL